MPRRKPHTATLLLVEDEQNLGATLKNLLEAERFDVCWAKNCKEALADLRSLRFDLALLDINLPDGSGLSLAEKLPGTPVIFLSALSAPEQRVQGLQLGAVDYIVKPFHFAELKLRIENALKASPPKTSGNATIGKVSVDFARQMAGGTPLGLKETRLLKLLYDRRGEVVSRDEILNHVWPREAFPTARTVDNFILKLRKIFGAQTIHSVRGVGYKLEVS